MPCAPKFTVLRINVSVLNIMNLPSAPLEMLCLSSLTMALSLTRWRLNILLDTRGAAWKEHPYSSTSSRGTSLIILIVPIKRSELSIDSLGRLLTYFQGYWTPFLMLNHSQNSLSKTSCLCSSNRNACKLC